MSPLPLGSTVKIVDDVGRENSNHIGKVGTVAGYKPNKFREGGTIPIIQLFDGSIVSGWGLFFELVIS